MFFPGPAVAHCRGACGFASTAPNSLRTPFTTVLARDFDAWDTNDDEVLAADEIDALVLDPSIKGDDAAAVAALKIVLRGGKFTVPPLTREYFTTYERIRLECR